MIFDIIVLAIMVIAMVRGFRKGFIYSFVSTLGWIGSFIGGLIGCRLLAEQLAEHTALQTNIYYNFLMHISESFDAFTSGADTLPLILNETIDTAASSAADALASRLTEITMTIISFLIIFVVIKILVFLISSMFSKRHNDGFIGFADGLLGLIAGTIKGILIVFLFLMLLMPALNFMSPASTELALQALENSYIAGTLYDSNFLMLVLS